MCVVQRSTARPSLFIHDVSGTHHVTSSMKMAEPGRREKPPLGRATAVVMRVSASALKARSPATVARAQSAKASRSQRAIVSSLVLIRIRERGAESKPAHLTPHACKPRNRFSFWKWKLYNCVPALFYHTKSPHKTVRDSKPNRRARVRGPIQILVPGNAVDF